MKWKRAVALVQAAVWVSLAAFAGTGGTAGTARAAEPAPAEAVVEMLGLRYLPPRLEVTTGTVVIWHNREPLDYPLIGGGHQILSEYYGAFESPDIAPGTRWQHRFDEPGVYRYRCQRHLGSTGEIVVTGEPVARSGGR